MVKILSENLNSLKVDYIYKLIHRIKNGLLLSGFKEHWLIKQSKHNSIFCNYKNYT